jgi:hypothetical protein
MAWCAVVMSFDLGRVSPSRFVADELRVEDEQCFVRGNDNCAKTAEGRVCVCVWYGRPHALSQPRYRYVGNIVSTLVSDHGTDHELGVAILAGRTAT